MDHHEAALFDQSLRDALMRHTGSALDGAVADVGWHEAMADDTVAAIALLFTLQGELGVSTSAISDVLGHLLGRRPDAMVVLPAPGDGGPPGRLDGAYLLVDGLAPGGLATRPAGLVVATTLDGDTAAYAVPVRELELTPVGGIDPDLSLLRVTGRVVPGATTEVPGTQRWEEMVAWGRLALAHQLVGASRTMLDQACDHARQRIQFGRPIAAFQAVRHRLAEAQVAISMAEAMVDAAWCETGPPSGGPALVGAAAMAKAVAGRQAKTVARHGQQVLAGIGFTDEHPFHRYVRRVLALDVLLGSSDSLTTALGRGVVADRRLPPLTPLERSAVERDGRIPDWSRGRHAV